MHWRTPFPPKRASILHELIVVLRQSLHPDTAMAEEKPADTEAVLPHEMPPGDAVPVIRVR